MQLDLSSLRYELFSIQDQKMWKNAKRAILEHRKKDEETYIALEALLPLKEMLQYTPSTSLTFTHFDAEAQGSRNAMEDAHFYLETDEAVVAGVFDGHGGKMVAEYANTAFRDLFLPRLEQNRQDIHQTFELLIDEIHKEVVKVPAWNSMGTTAVVSYINKKTHRVYTATLGDSESNLYRIENAELKSIPLSCVRDWTSPNDALRASIANGDPEIATEWPKKTNPKVVRFPSSFGGVNVSRAIGDVRYAGTVARPGVIHKPKITMNQVKSGDILVLACDGLKDFVPEKEIVQLLEKDDPDPAHLLLRQALKTGTDNVTVLAIKID